MTFIIILILLGLALTGLFMILVPLGVYLWYRKGLNKLIKKGQANDTH